jgi:hypothetical protein
LKPHASSLPHAHHPAGPADGSNQRVFEPHEASRAICVEPQRWRDRPDLPPPRSPADGESGDRAIERRHFELGALAKQRLRHQIEEGSPPVKSDGTAGLTADDPDAGEERKQAYERGATLVSRID